jgi:hypothetical protein
MDSPRFVDGGKQDGSGPELGINVCTRGFVPPPRSCEYEFIDSKELAARWHVPESWVRDYVRSRVDDPLPHVNFGKYVRFLWGSPELEDWVARRIVMGNNRRVERVP